MIDRIPPNNIDAEQSVLSALFINNAGFDSIETLRPEDFYKTAHQKIFRAMLDLRGKKEPVDLVTVAQALNVKSELESVGGAVYLSKIADSAPVALNVGQYGKVIRDLAITRETIAIATRIAEQGYLSPEVDDYISTAQADILKIQTTTSQDKVFSMGDLVQSALDRIEAAQTGDAAGGLNIGFPKLGPLLNISGSKLILIAGRPGMGKTALALSVALFLARQGVSVGFLSIEMDKESLADRILSVEANINFMCFYEKGMLTQRSFNDLNMAADSLYHLPFFVDDADCKIQDVERKCRKFKKMGCQVIFIDQLSKIRGQAGASKFETYTDNCSAIALVKKELRIPIFLLCQLNRNVESRSDKRPELSDLKQTGMLEEDADMVFLLFRPGYYDENVDQSRTEIILAKNRQGAKGTETQVLFNSKRGMFHLSA